MTVFSVIRGESIDFACKLARGYGQKGTPRGRRILVRRNRIRPGTLRQKNGVRPAYSETARFPSATSRPPKHDHHHNSGGIHRTGPGRERLPRRRNRIPQALRKLCDKARRAPHLDETQTGLGRTGKKFACEYSAVIPDVLVIGEALAGIFPIAATMFTKRRTIHECPSHDTPLHFRRIGSRMPVVAKPSTNMNASSLGTMRPGVERSFGKGLEARRKSHP